MVCIIVEKIKSANQYQMGYHEREDGYLVKNEAANAQQAAIYCMKKKGKKPKKKHISTQEILKKNLKTKQQRKKKIRKKRQQCKVQLMFLISHKIK